MEDELDAVDRSPPKPPTPERPKIGVGLFVLDSRGRFILMRRRGSHGAGAWGLVGGHLEFGRSPQEAAADEAMEELGLRIRPEDVAMGPWTNDIFEDEGKHYVTLYGSTPLPDGQAPVNLEPHKCTEFGWFTMASLPAPLFVPVRNLVARGYMPPFPWGSTIGAQNR